MDWVDSLDASGEFSDLAVLAEPQADEITRDRLEGIAKSLNEAQLNLTDAERLAGLYTALETQTADLIAARDVATTDDAKAEVAAIGKEIGQAAILLSDQLATDLASSNPEVRAAAEGVQDELARSGEVYYTVFTGLGVNQEVSRETLADGSLRVLGFLEEGTYTLSDSLRVELGSQPAMVQGTITGGVAPVVIAAPQLQDMCMNVAGVMINGTGMGTTLPVSNASGNEMALILIDLTSQQGKLPTQATLKLSTIGSVPLGSTHKVTAYDRTWAAPLNETMFGGSDYADLLGEFRHFRRDSAITYVSGGSQVVTGANTVDVTDAVQRSLLFGDSNVDGIVTISGTSSITSNVGNVALGDVEAFYQAVRNWSAYVGQYQDVHGLVDEVELVFRNDANWDNVVDSLDMDLFFARLGTTRGNYTLDGATTAGNTGADYSRWSQNYGRVATRFSQGDGDFNGYVSDLDLTVWQQSLKGSNTAIQPPSLPLQVEGTGAATGTIEYASNQYATNDEKPKLDIYYDKAYPALTGFVGQGGSDGKLEVQYRVPHVDVNNPTLKVYRISAGSGSEELISTNPTILPGSVTSTETPHSHSFNPSPITNPDQDYRIVARHYVDDVQVSERELTGGIFRDNTPGGGNRHVWGNVGKDIVDIYENHLGLSGDLTPNSVIFTTAPENLYVRTFAGYDVFDICADLVRSAWLSGGDQNDTYFLRSYGLTQTANLRIKDDSGIDTIDLQEIDTAFLQNLNLGSDTPHAVAHNGNNASFGPACCHLPDHPTRRSSLSYCVLSWSRHCCKLPNSMFHDLFLPASRIRFILDDIASEMTFAILLQSA